MGIKRELAGVLLSGYRFTATGAEQGSLAK